MKRTLVLFLILSLLAGMLLGCSSYEDIMTKHAKRAEGGYTCKLLGEWHGVQIQAKVQGGESGFIEFESGALSGVRIAKEGEKWNSSLFGELKKEYTQGELLLLAGLLLPDEASFLRAQGKGEESELIYSARLCELEYFLVLDGKGCPLRIEAGDGSRLLISELSFFDGIKE